ncbi:hypothetical protein KIF59_06500 [Enterobacter cloacae subsp. cloacae]|nr:hypothetical protein [Enterobacter cloacae subsp. cloacae]
MPPARLSAEYIIHDLQTGNLRRCCVLFASHAAAASAKNPLLSDPGAGFAPLYGRTSGSLPGASRNSTWFKPQIIRVISTRSNSPSPNDGGSLHAA